MRHADPRKTPLEPERANSRLTATLTVEMSLFQKSLWTYVPWSSYVT